MDETIRVELFGNKQPPDSISWTKALTRRTKMPSKTKLALATLLVLGCASPVLAGTNGGTDQHGSVVRRAAPATISNDRMGTVSHAEGGVWFAAPQLAFVRNATAGKMMAWIKLTEPSGKQLHINVEHVTSVRSATLVPGAEAQLELASGKFQGVLETVNQVMQLITAAAGDQVADVDKEPRH
jgi:hypothetical protein